MLTNVLPGLRELRAPLAAGYLWLLFAWLVWGDELPSKSAEAADAERTPLDRFFELEPVVTSIGVAVVASVTAYVLGSIVIDVQRVMGARGAEVRVVAQWLLGEHVGDLPFVAAVVVVPLIGVTAALILAFVTSTWVALAVLVVSVIGWESFVAYRGRRERGRSEAESGPVGHLALTDAGSSMLERWELNRMEELGEEFRAERRALRDSLPALERDRDDADRQFAAARDRARDRVEVHGDTELAKPQEEDLLAELARHQSNLTDHERGLKVTRYLTSALDFPPQEIDRATRDYIVTNRDLLTARLIDASPPLHSEFDRPDAEATFRMALWPPLAALLIYLALDESPWWWFALVVPILLAWQWLSLRRKANDALVAAFVARDELGGKAAEAEVRKAVVGRIIESLRLRGGEGYEPPSFMLDYVQKPTPPPPPTSPRPVAPAPMPGSGSPAANGQPKAEDAQPSDESEPEPPASQSSD